MILNSQKTIYNIMLQNALLADVNYRPLINTTLNEKFGILANYDLPIDNTKKPKLNIMVAGIGGANILNNNLFNTKRSKHSPTDGALFEHVPFYFKRQKDVIPNELNNYYLIKKINVNNETYVVCFGKYIEDIYLDPNIYRIANTDLVTNIVKHDTEIDNTILNPEPISNLDYTSIPNVSVMSLMRTSIKINNDEIEAMKRYRELVLGINNDNLSITELGLASSIIIDINNIKGSEAIWTQLMYILDTNLKFQLGTVNDPIDINVEIGGMEPLGLLT